jgi:hypothetical protein
VWELVSLLLEWPKDVWQALSHYVYNMHGVFACITVFLHSLIKFMEFYIIPEEGYATVL